MLQELWNAALPAIADTEIRARIIGVSSQMQHFRFFFGITLAELIFRHSDNLSRTLQKKSVSAVEGQSVAEMTVATLRSIREEGSFRTFRQKSIDAAAEHDVGEPELPRKRKTPRTGHRYDSGLAPPSLAATAEEYYQQIYYEAIDLICTCITNKFDQPGYKTYSVLQSLILQASIGSTFEKELHELQKLYSSDFKHLLAGEPTEDIWSQLPCCKELFITRDIPRRVQVCQRDVTNPGRSIVRSLHPYQVSTGDACYKLHQRAESNRI